MERHKSGRRSPSPRAFEQDMSSRYLTSPGVKAYESSTSRADFAHSGLINPRETSHDTPGHYRIASPKMSISNLAHNLKTGLRTDPKDLNVRYHSKLAKKAKDIKKKYASYKPILVIKAQIRSKNSTTSNLTLKSRKMTTSNSTKRRVAKNMYQSNSTHHLKSTLKSIF